MYGYKGVKNMGCGCNQGSGSRFGAQDRSFLTKGERVDLLKEYRDELEKEVQGVSEKIKELEAN
ncbi:MAG TPA: hypothetical protein VIY08_16665 [Candidatus Nitrosocosmicus sp.]